MDFNNCSNISNISGSVEEYLRHLQDKVDITMIPAVTMLIIFAVTGLIGNTLVLVVYSQKFKLNPTKVLIMTIACFDLVANVAAIPVAIVTMLDTWNFTRPAVCKATVFLGAFTALGGAISLLIVAVVRYRKVCRPYGWQVTIRQAIISSTVAFLFAFIISIPYILIYGVRTRQTPCPKIFGSDCFADDYYFYTIWPLLNNVLFVIVYLAMSVSLVVLYTLLGVTAWKHRKLHGASANVPKVKTADSSSPGVSSVDKEQGGMPEDAPEKQQTMSSNLIQTTHVGHGRVLSLLCWTRQEGGGTSEENTQSSITLKTYATTDSENEVIDTDSPDAELGVTNKSASSVDTTVKASRSSRFMSPENLVTDETKDPTNVGTNVQDDAPVNMACQKNIEKENNPQRDPKKQNPYAAKNPASKMKSPAKIKENRRPLGRMTAMLIIISAIFVFGFLPFLILTIFKSRFPERYAAMDMVEQTFYNLFYRLYFLNSAANPIIYSLCDTNFRRHCLQVLTCRLRKYL